MIFYDITCLYHNISQIFFMANKLLKKIIGIFGYKLIDKNLFKNDRLASTNSFLKIDKLLNVMFIEKGINSLIQIGANDGERFDLLNFYIKKFQSKSLLVEPIKENFEKLKKNYSNYSFVTFENSAISINNDNQKIYKVAIKYLDEYDDHIPGISSFDKKHLIKHGVKNRHIVSETVSSISMPNLIKKHNLVTFDLLYIDAEGYDGEIAINFLLTTLIRPIIILEYIHISNATFKRLIAVLKKEGYTLFSLDENLVCYPILDKKFIKFN